VGYFRPVRFDRIGIPEADESKYRKGVYRDFITLEWSLIASVLQSPEKKFPSVEVDEKY